MIPPHRQPDQLVVTRDAWGRAIIAKVVNGLTYEVHNSRDFDRDSWTALAEEVTGSGTDTAAREALRLSPAERRDT